MGMLSRGLEGYTLCFVQTHQWFLYTETVQEGHADIERRAEWWKILWCLEGVFVLVAHMLSNAVRHVLTSSTA